MFTDIVIHAASTAAQSAGSLPRREGENKCRGIVGEREIGILAKPREGCTRDSGSLEQRKSPSRLTRQLVYAYCRCGHPTVWPQRCCSVWILGFETHTQRAIAGRLAADEMKEMEKYGASNGKFRHPHPPTKPNKARDMTRHGIFAISISRLVGWAPAFPAPTATRKSHHSLAFLPQQPVNQ